ncbi:hypothetical protein N9E95_00090 [Alphaproteobacteria bacterium]|nr:hypothetical protein [Alphaproteobacteria bacterium]
MNIVNKLVVISIPFSRNFRYLVSSEIYKNIKKQFDILIIMPGMEGNSEIEKDFGGDNVRFYYYNQDHKGLSKILRSIYLLTEGLRRFGYYYKYRNKQLKYYWEISTGKYSRTLDEDGLATRQKLIYRFLCFFIGLIGRNKNFWRRLGFLFGKFFFDLNDINKVTSNYEKIVLIQTANWGFQERFLSFWAYKNKCKTILVPYTTDQILINGYMITDYDFYCPQGSIEEEYLLNFHDVGQEKICKLGMIWLRVLEKTNVYKKIESNKNLKDTIRIMYTGLVSTAYPILSELETVDRILYEIKNGQINANKLVYRPVLVDIKTKKTIEDRYSNNSLIELQWPQTAMIGINGEITSSVTTEIEEYLEQLVEIDLMIMSATTTMAFDAFKLDIPCIANFYNANDSFCKNGFSKSYIDTDEFIISAKGMPVVHTLDELIRETKKLINNPCLVKETKESTFTSWDYHNKNYVNDFIRLL